MFYRKKARPEEGEIVICTVKKILYHSVFVSIDEYETLEGMLHISEVSPGRIRNIRDYVKEGKQLVCKVLRIDRERGHIDVSLRRVNNSQRINKIQEYKKEQKAEKILELVGKELKKDLSKMYAEIGYDLIEDFGSLNLAFENILLDEELVNELKIPKKISEILVMVIKEKIKRPEVEINEIIELSSDNENGIDIIKSILTKLKKGDIKLRYISAPKYKVVVRASDYKTAEGILEQLNKDTEKLAKENNAVVSFSRSK